MNFLSIRGYMNRTEKYKKLREQLKLESLVIEATYLKAQSDELLKHTTQFKKYIQKEYHTDLPKVYVGDINIQQGQTY